MALLKVLILLLFFISFSARAEDCKDLVPEAQTESGLTEDFISYLESLYEHQVITESQLLQFQYELQKSSMVNPIPYDEAEVNSVLRIHYGNLQALIDSNELQVSKLLDWSNKHLKTIETVRNETDQVRKETSSLDRRIKFFKITAASFESFHRDNEPYQPIKQITRDIEMMDAPITHAQWVKIMGEAPAFSEGPKARPRRRNNEPGVPTEPDFPVNNVSWWSVLEFANRLSKAEGLRPVYDLSKIKFDPKTRAEDGTLALLQKESPLDDFLKERGIPRVDEMVFVKAAYGDIYRAEGYRVPTLAEWQLAYSKIEKAELEYKPKSIDEHLLEEVRNNKAFNRSVDHIPPVLIENNEFYGFRYGMDEWVWDLYLDPPRKLRDDQAAQWMWKRAEGKDPVSETNSSSHFRMTVTGGAYYDDIDHADERKETVSFRLVRTLPGQNNWLEGLWPF